MGQRGQDTGYASHIMRRDVVVRVATYPSTVQCPNEKCRNDEAYWYQLQIRSADEPMTAFYKVCQALNWTGHSLTFSSAPSARKNGENSWRFLHCIQGV